MTHKISTTMILTGLLAPLSADQVINDDLIVTSSECIGFDCVNGESFGFDTLRLKENNLRIKFQDTSSSASFPSNDWQITINDTTNGGANRFSIDDIDGGRTPFTIEASAPTHSLYVDDGGRIGLGTSTPVVQLHQKDGNTPTLRLEQDGSSGFTAQTWDVAGNEANFFIRDATNGSKLPFRIYPGAATDSLTIKGNGDVGVGTNSPDSALHVKRADGTAQLYIEDTHSQTNQAMIRLTGNSNPYMLFENTANPSLTWAVGYGLDNFSIAPTGSGGAAFAVYDDGTVKMGLGNSEQFVLSPTGDLTIKGTLTDSSDRNMKENIVPADSRQILNKIETLPLYSWNYIANKNDETHFGAMAQDFYKEFAFGPDDKHIAPKDAAFIAMAGVQALKKELDAKNKTIEALNKKIDALEKAQARIADLEAMIDKLAGLQNASNKNDRPVALKAR